MLAPYGSDVCREFGSQRPMDVRNAVYQTLYDTLLSSIHDGLPLAGAHSNGRVTAPFM